MNTKKTFFVTVVYAATMLSAAYAQDKLQLTDTITDEVGYLRYFRLSDKEPASKIVDATPFLKSALKADEHTNFRFVKTKTKRNNQKSVLYQQLYKDVPVYDAYYYLHYANETFTYANGEYAAIEEPVNSILINEAAAIDAAVKSASVIIGLKPVSTKAKLALWRQNTQSNYRYVYEVDVLFADPTKSKICMVDTETSEVLLKVDVVCNVNVPCTGATVYSGNRNFTGDTIAGGVRLRQERDGVDISTLNNQNNVAVNSVDFENTTTTWTSAGASEGALDVHFGVEMFLDYFRTVFDRNSIDDDDHQIISLLNRWEQVTPTITQPMDNAFFDPNDIRFSFGNGNTIFNSVTSLDVVAHELAHGFAHFEVGFNTTGEARSLNEGFSDIWGATIENWSAIQGKETWMMGEEIMANGFSCLRSIRNPSGEGFRPDLTSPTEGNYPDTRLGDFWDVNNTAPPHINATVLGHWYFLLSQGGTGTNDLNNDFNVGGLGIQTAAQIAYNTELALTPSADFTSVRTASIAYATQEWGANSCEVKTVTDAWFAVGVGTGYNGTLGASLTGPSLVCTSGATFMLNNAPAGATVTWAATPTKMFALGTTSGSGTTATPAAKSSNTSSSGTITFTINTGCGNPVQISQSIWVGKPAGLETIALGLDSSPPYYVCKNTTYQFNAFDFTNIPGTTYAWHTYGNHTIISYNGTGNITANIQTGNTPNGTYISAQAQNACGSSAWTDVLLYEQTVGCGGGFFSIYPNPADNYLYIEIDKSEYESAAFQAYEVSLLDNNGTEKLRTTTSDKSKRIDTSAFKSGLYFLNVSYKGELLQRQVVISR